MRCNFRPCLPFVRWLPASLFAALFLSLALSLALPGQVTAAECQNAITVVPGANACLFPKDIRAAESVIASADALRHLGGDPLLPAELCPPGWPGAELRAAHRSFDDAFAVTWRRWHRGVDGAAPGR